MYIFCVCKNIKNFVKYVMPYIYICKFYKQISKYEFKILALLHGIVTVISYITLHYPLLEISRHRVSFNNC